MVLIIIILFLHSITDKNLYQSFKQSETKNRIKKVFFVGAFYIIVADFILTGFIEILIKIIQYNTQSLPNPQLILPIIQNHQVLKSIFENFFIQNHNKSLSDP